MAAALVGDINANIEQLKALLRQVRYPLHALDRQGLCTGQPASLLPILHYAFLDFSVFFHDFHAAQGHELRSKSDLRFLEGVFRVLREQLLYHPKLTTAQFFSSGFAERKVLFCQDVLRLVLRTHEQLAGARPSSHTRPRRASDARRVTDAGGAAGGAWDAPADCALEAPLQRHHEPRPPPEPSSLGSVYEAGRGGPPAVAGREAAPPPCGAERADEARAPPTSGPLKALRDLLEEIRQSLERRFDDLEQRFEAYTEGADARTTVLEGKVAILTAKLQDVLSSGMAAPEGEAAPTSADGASRPIPTGASACPEAPLDGVGAPPARQRAAASRGPPCFEGASPGAPAGPSRAAGAPLPGGEQPGPGSQAWTSPWPSAAASLPPPRSCCGWRAPAPPGDGPQAGPPLPRGECSSLEQDTQLLIEKISGKFRDTEDLISRAQERVARIVGGGAGTPPAQGPCRCADAPGR